MPKFQLRVTLERVPEEGLPFPILAELMEPSLIRGQLDDEENMSVEGVFEVGSEEDAKDIFDQFCGTSF